MAWVKKASEMIRSWGPNDEEHRQLAREHLKANENPQGIQVGDKVENVEEIAWGEGELQPGEQGIVEFITPRDQLIIMDEKNMNTIYGVRVYFTLTHHTPYGDIDSSDTLTCNMADLRKI